MHLELRPFRADQVKIKQLGWAVTNMTGVLLEKRASGPRQAQTQREDHVDRRGGGETTVYKPSKESTLPTRGS